MYTSAVIKERINDILSDLRSESLSQYPRVEITIPRHLIARVISTLESIEHEMSTLECNTWR